MMILHGKEFNRGAEVLLGYEAEELVGERSVAIFHDKRSGAFSRFKEFDETIADLMFFY
jgi:hypothetical protein